MNHFNNYTNTTPSCSLSLHAVLKSFFFSGIPAFLLHESLPGLVRIRCGHPATSYLWSKSDDGSTVIDEFLINFKWKFSKNLQEIKKIISICLDIITGVDGGLYRCVYGGIWTSPQLCVYVFC